MNLHFSVSTDLFGQELSTNAANYYNSGIKGRFGESKIEDDHLLHDSCYSILEILGDKIVTKEVPAINAVNERLRDDYIHDSNLGVRRWNKIISDFGFDFRFNIPHRAFNRSIGQFSDRFTTPEGNIITKLEWEHRKDDWLPSYNDKKYVQSIMQPVIEPGKIANWISPPIGKINRQPFEFEYIRFN